MKSVKIMPPLQHGESATETRMKAMEIIGILLAFFGDDDKVVAWLEAPNGNFGNARPIDLINSGRVDKVLLFCRQSAEDNQPPKSRTLQ